MKIFVNARFLTQPVSGVQRYGIECSRQIKKLYPQVTFLAPKNILHTDIARELDVKIIGTNSGHLWEQADLPLYLLGKGSPPLYSPANTAPLLYSNNYFTLHDLAFYHHPEWNTKTFSAWYNILVPRLAHNCRHMFTVSETIRSEIIEYYRIPPSKISVTYNGLSAQMLSMDREEGTTKEKIILAVGTFNKRKNHQNLVNAFLRSTIKNEYQLVIVGDKNRVFADSGLDKNHLNSSNIQIFDKLSSEELVNMYAKAKILASLSVYEGFGIPVLEGIYNGCKIICSDIAVYHELYDGYVNFCNPYDVLNISTVLDRVSSSDDNISSDRVNTLLDKYNYTHAAQIIIDSISKA